MEEVIPINEIGDFEELKYSWNRLLNSIDGLPQYFGLIAIQCLAASQMHRDQTNAEGAYNVRLCEILNLPDSVSLQYLFKGLNPDQPVQEGIWYSAKAYFKKYFQQDLDIPARTIYAGRFVQYPKSQALFNLEDIRRFTQFFSSEFLPGEEVPFSYFRQRLEAAWFNIDITSRAWELLKERQKKEKCWQQLYEYFNSWDGMIYSTNNGKINESKKALAEASYYSVLLTFDNGLPQFHLMDRNNAAIVQQVTGEFLFQLSTIASYHNGLFVFTEIDYPNEYESGRFIYTGSTCYLLLDVAQRSQESHLLENNNKGRFEISHNKVLYAYQHEDHHLLLRHLVQQKNPVVFTGGIKVSRRREYLESFGPTIHCSQAFRVICENFNCEYEPHKARSGSYRVRVDHFRDIKFHIAESIPLSTPVLSKNKGWNIARYTIDQNFEIEGLRMDVRPKVPKSFIREWIRVSLQHKKEKYAYQQSLLKAINNTKGHL